MRTKTQTRNGSPQQEQILLDSEVAALTLQQNCFQQKYIEGEFFSCVFLERVFFFWKHERVCLCRHVTVWVCVLVPHRDPHCWTWGAVQEGFLAGYSASLAFSLSLSLEHTHTHTHTHTHKLQLFSNTCWDWHSSWCVMNTGMMMTHFCADVCTVETREWMGLLLLWYQCKAFRMHITMNSIGQRHNRQSDMPTLSPITSGCFWR